MDPIWCLERVLYQDLVKISLALENGDLEKNSALNGVLEKSDRVHIIGLLSDVEFTHI